MEVQNTKKNLNSKWWKFRAAKIIILMLQLNLKKIISNKKETVNQNI